MAWPPASGRGKIFALNRHELAFHPGFKEEVPYFYALIELEEGPLISRRSWATACRRMSTTWGRGEVVYEDHPAEGFTLPNSIYRFAS